MCLIVICGNFPVVFIKKASKEPFMSKFQERNLLTVLGIIVTKQNDLAFYVIYSFYVFKGHYKIKAHFQIVGKVLILLKNMKTFFIKNARRRKSQIFITIQNGLTWKIKQRDFHQQSHTCRLPNNVFSTRFLLSKERRKGIKESTCAAAARRDGR